MGSLIRMSELYKEWSTNYTTTEKLFDRRADRWQKIDWIYRVKIGYSPYNNSPQYTYLVVFDNGDTKTMTDSTTMKVKY